MKTFLLILAVCTQQPGIDLATCAPSEAQASVYEMLTFARCVQEREAARAAGFEAHCTGSPWLPPHAAKG